MVTDKRTPLVPDDFQPPAGLVTASFLLEPLGPQHNEPTTTPDVQHGAHPGHARLPDGNWPHDDLEQNRGDLSATSATSRTVRASPCSTPARGR